MIHLDTNCIVGLVATKPSALKSSLLSWLTGGMEFAASSIAWSEFLNGPVTSREIQDAAEILEGRIIPFGILEAERSATLFNLAGRKRGTQPDCFIAATAICARASLATLNGDDFRKFIPAGLRLA